MQWITRERPKIDRIACPWLIARFIDKEAEFVYVPAEEIFRRAEQTGAIPYDIPGAELSHVGELCSFDAFLKKYDLSDPALQALAVIVRGADIGVLPVFTTCDGPRTEAAGLTDTIWPVTSQSNRWRMAARCCLTVGAET